MNVTIKESEWEYTLIYWSVEGGEQYEISVEHLKQIKECKYYEVQTVIRQIVAEYIFK